MIFKDLINRVSIQEVCKRLVKLYPDQENLLYSYISVFNKLKDTEPVISQECEVLLVSPTEDSFEDNLYYDNVSLYNIKEKQYYALEFTPWKEWLGYRVPEKAVAFYGEATYVAHCLYEMTFISFDEEKIEEEINELKEISDSIERGECKTYSMEEVCDSLGIEHIKPMTVEEKTETQIKVEKRRKNNDEILKRLLF